MEKEGKERRKGRQTVPTDADFSVLAEGDK